MYRMKESWTDERLDDLNAKVDRGFEKVDAHFTEMEQRLDQRFDRIERHFEGIDQRIFQTLLGLAGLQITTFGVLLGFIVALH